MATSWYRRTLTQTVTYWAPSSRDEYNVTTFVTPAAIPGRWEEKTNMIVDSAGREVVSDAQVFLYQVVVEGGYLLLGTSVVADPTGVAGARIVRKYLESPDLKGNDIVRKAML